VTLALFLWMLGGLMKGSDVGPKIELAPKALGAIVADMVVSGIGADAGS
jgi:hypothetical protein